MRFSPRSYVVQERSLPISQIGKGWPSNQNWRTIYGGKSLYTHAVFHSRSEKRTWCAVHEKTLLPYLYRLVTVIREDRQDKSTFVCLYIQRTLSGGLILEYIRNIEIDEDEKHDLAHFLIVNGFCLWRISGMFMSINEF